MRKDALLDAVQVSILEYDFVIMGVCFGPRYRDTPYSAGIGGCFGDSKSD